MATITTPIITDDTGQDIVSALQNLASGNDSIAPAFSASSTYNVGDLVIYNNTLFKCTTAITTAGSWDASKWSATNIKTELKSTKPVSEGGTGATDASGARTNLGLGNVGNFKAVSTAASQGLTSTEQSNARSNMGLGSAATKSSTTSISSGGSGLPTSGTVYSYTKQVYIGTTAPSSNQSNYLWIDTSS